MHSAVALLTLVMIPLAHAQHAKVSRLAWDGLTQEERAAIQAGNVVELYEHGTFGLVIDAQGADRSDPGTNAGALLGSVGAQAAYIDRAFSGSNNYSALTQLGMGILGGVLGSALDRPASQKYQFRYALRLSNGEIQYADAMSSDPFRHPPGVCLSLPDLRPMAQTVCGHGPDELRRAYLGTAALQAAPAPAQPVSTSQPAPVVVTLPQADAPATGALSCRIGALPPVSTTAEKCSAIGGISK